MAFRWRADDDPTLNAGLVVFENCIFSIAKKFYVFVIFQVGGCPPPPPPSGSAHGTGLCLHLLRYIENPFYRAHRLLYDTLRTFYRSTSRRRERCVFFLNFVIFFNSTYLKDSCISLQKILIDEMSLSDCITL